MTHKLDDMIELPKSQPKRTYNEDLECKIVMVKMPKCMAWLDDEAIGDLDTMEDKAKIPSLRSTHKSSYHLSSKGFPSVDEPEPQLLTNFSPLDVIFDEKKLGSS
ncbi:hypothetical protein Tco_0968134 [Tanacetum coccineum]